MSVESGSVLRSLDKICFLSSKFCKMDDFELDPSEANGGSQKRKGN